MQFAVSDMSNFKHGWGIQGSWDLIGCSASVRPRGVETGSQVWYLLKLASAEKKGTLSHTYRHPTGAQETAGGAQGLPGLQCES